MKRVSVGALKNGFRFYTQLDDRAHVSGIGVKAGSIHDPLAFRGMCHVAEHMTGRYSREQELKFEEYLCGPEENINIRIDHSSTFFGHDLLLRREHMLELFGIIANGMKNPTIDREALESEKAAVLNEYYLRGVDAMESHIHDLMHQAMYKRNPVRNRIDCEPEEIRCATAEDVQVFVRSHYVPNNMFAVILGPSFRKAKDMAEQYFGEMQPSVIPFLAYDFSENRPSISELKYREEERVGIHQYHVAVGFPTEPMGDKDDEALDVLSEIWRWRIRTALRDQNCAWGKGAYRVLSFTPRSFAHGMIYITFATPSEDFARFGIERIITECNALKTKWVRNDELTAMSNKLYHGYVEDLTQSPGKLAERIISAAANGDEDMRRLNSFLGRLARVGKKSLMRVANEYFTTPNYVAALIKPVPEQNKNERGAEEE